LSSKRPTKGVRNKMGMNIEKNNMPVKAFEPMRSLLIIISE